MDVSIVGQYNPATSTYQLCNEFIVYRVYLANPWSLNNWTLLIVYKNILYRFWALRVHETSPFVGKPCISKRHSPLRSVIRPNNYDVAYIQDKIIISIIRRTREYTHRIADQSCEICIHIWQSHWQRRELQHLGYPQYQIQSTIRIVQVVHPNRWGLRHREENCRAKCCPTIHLDVPLLLWTWFRRSRWRKEDSLCF